MARTKETPKINMVTVSYNGDSKQFELFMESLISDYLNSDKIAKSSADDVIDNVEINSKTA